MSLTAEDRVALILGRAIMRAEALAAELEQRDERDTPPEPPAKKKP